MTAHGHEREIVKEKDMNANERMTSMWASSAKRSRASMPRRASSARLADIVRDALRAGEFFVAFQPLVHAQTRQASSVECVLRWRHPELGVLLPGAFVDAFHDPDTARDAAYFVLESACRELSAWRQTQGLPPGAAINVQPSLLIDEGASERIAEIAARHGIPLGLIELEVAQTEDTSTLLSMLEFTDPFRRLGIRLTCDAFGTGQSQLSTLSSLHVDAVKLARPFLLNVPESRRACRVLSAVLDLLADLDLTAIVDGVDSGSQFNWLSLRQDVLVQGQFVGRPERTINEALAR
jgi:EAL domain-containing protein (putative c-di-GMP-specific phosphodiesterase class I)